MGGKRLRKNPKDIVVFESNVTEFTMCTDPTIDIIDSAWMSVYRVDYGVP